MSIRQKLRKFSIKSKKTTVKSYSIEDSLLGMIHPTTQKATECNQSIIQCPLPKIIENLPHTLHTHMHRITPFQLTMSAIGYKPADLQPTTMGHQSTSQRAKGKRPSPLFPALSLLISPKTQLAKHDCIVKNHLCRILQQQTLQRLSKSTAQPLTFPEQIDPQ